MPLLVYQIILPIVYANPLSPTNITSSDQEKNDSSWQNHNNLIRDVDDIAKINEISKVESDFLVEGKDIGVIEEKNEESADTVKEKGQCNSTCFLRWWDVCVLRVPTKYYIYPYSCCDGCGCWTC